MPFPDFISSEFELLKSPVASITRLLALASWDEDQTTAFGTYIQNVYMGIERILQYMLKEGGASIPKSPMWHYDLLKLAYSKCLVPLEVEPVLEDLMKYRHRHVHGYGHMLEEARLRKLAAPLAQTFDAFKGHIEEIYTAID